MHLNYEQRSRQGRFTLVLALKVGVSLQECRFCFTYLSCAFCDLTVIFTVVFVTLKGPSELQFFSPAFLGVLVAL